MDDDANNEEEEDRPPNFRGLARSWSLLLLSSSFGLSILLLLFLLWSSLPFDAAAAAAGIKMSLSNCDAPIPSQSGFSLSGLVVASNRTLLVVNGINGRWWWWW